LWLFGFVVIRFCGYLVLWFEVIWFCGLRFRGWGWGLKGTDLGEVRTHVGDAVDREALGVVVVVDGDLVVVQVHQVVWDVPQVQLHLRRSAFDGWC